MFRALMMLVLLAVGPPLATGQQLASEQDRRAALAFYRTGEAHMRAERFDLAAAAFTSAVERDPLFTTAYYQLGQSYMALQRYASATKAYEDCIEANRTLFNLAQADRFQVERARDDEIREMRASLQQMNLNGQQLRAAHAEQYLQTLERQRSELGKTFRPSPEVLLALGSARFRNGDTDGAQADWLAAVEANPKLGEAHNNLAALHAMNRRKKEAAEEVRAAERAGFRVNPQLKRDIERLPD